MFPKVGKSPESAGVPALNIRSSKSLAQGGSQPLFHGPASSESAGSVACGNGGGLNIIC